MSQKAKYNPGYSIKSNELFKGKSIPPFIKEHPAFNVADYEVRKIFPLIGLPNFREPVKIDKSFTDIRKEGSFVFNLLKVISQHFANTASLTYKKFDEFQYVFDDDVEYKNIVKKLEILTALNDGCQKLSGAVDPYHGTNTIVIEDGVITLFLPETIKNNAGKMIYSKSSKIIPIYNKVKEQAAKVGIDMPNFDTIPEAKIFAKENIPNKQYNVVFSSEGPTGAWDIATMSMRGIKSCQRWDGEYHKCLVGSIVSKFTAIIYITSGVDINNMGEKMLTRCLVRHCVNSYSKKNAIMIDRMYPNYDPDLVKIFIDTLKKRVPDMDVFFGHNSDQSSDPSKIASLRLTEDKKYNKYITQKEFRSYYDTPIKTKSEHEDLCLAPIISSLPKIKNELLNSINLELLQLSSDMVKLGISDNNSHFKKYFMFNYSNNRLPAILERLASEYGAKVIQPFVARHDNIGNCKIKYIKSYLMTSKQLNNSSDLRSRFRDNITSFSFGGIDNEFVIVGFAEMFRKAIKNVAKDLYSVNYI